MGHNSKTEAAPEVVPRHQVRAPRAPGLEGAAVVVVEKGKADLGVCSFRPVRWLWCSRRRDISLIGARVRRSVGVLRRRGSSQ